MSDTVMQAMVYALVLVLPLSALVARRMPLTTTARYAAVWIAIFAIGFMIVTSFT